jgi:hypothetical protein
MSNNKLLFCKSCNSFYKPATGADLCPDCKIKLEETTIDYKQYSSLSSEQKQIQKINFLIENGMDEHSAYKAVCFEPKPNTKWLMVFVVCGILAFVAYVISAVIQFSTVLGIPDAICSLGIAVLILAFTFVFKQFVADIHHIRNVISKKYE